MGDFERPGVVVSVPAIRRTIATTSNHHVHDGPLNRAPHAQNVSKWRITGPMNHLNTPEPTGENQSPT